MNEREFLAIPEKERLNRSLEGIAYYASVFTPNRSGEKKFKSPPVYIVKLGLDTDEELEKAVSYGLKIHPKEEAIPYPYVKIQSKIRPKGTKTLEERIEETKPEVVDSMQNPIPSSILIGNGSRVIVKFLTNWHQMSDAHGVGTWLNKVQVRKLVKYTPVEKGLVMDDDGFTVDSFDEDMPDDSDKLQEVFDVKESKPKKATKKGSDGEVFLDESIFDKE